MVKFSCYNELMNNNQDSERLLIVDGKTTRLESPEEEKARIAAAKAELDKLFREGKITGIEYNKRVVALTVPKEIKMNPPKKKFAGAPFFLIIFLAILSVPAIVYISWRFYFQNNLSLDNVPNYYDTSYSSLNSEPVQINFNNITKTGEYKGRAISITYRAYYDITGIVVSVRDYWGFGAYDTLVPRDVCLIWGDLVETYQRRDAEFSQGERNCKPKIHGMDIEDLDAARVRGGLGNTMYALHEFSNNHIIPSTPEIRNQIFGLGIDDVVRLTGYLVQVEYNGIILDSSLSREDFGNGACEVFYVTKVEKQ